jgi:uncharacterized protein (TIGR04255 family)
MSRLRPADLPDYENPPLNEILLSLQFSQPSGFGNVQIVLLWQKLFKEKFPNYQEQPPLQPLFEVFGPNPIPLPSIQISMAVPEVRYWFTNDDEVIQIQNNRFIHNWRKTREDQKYPHYETIRENFTKEIELIAGFLNENKLGELQVNQCEVSYINHIEFPDGKNPHTNLHRVFRSINENETVDHSSSLLLEDCIYQTRYSINHENTKIGRLHVQAIPAIRRSDQKPIIQLTLIARGRPIGNSIDSAFEFMDLGRSLIVKHFDLFTTVEMHDFWRKNHDNI